MHSDGSITGTCTLSDPVVYQEHYSDGSSLWRNTDSDATMPDGTTIAALCYEKYIGKPNHGAYQWPMGGTAEFTATPQEGGGYFVLIHTEGFIGCYNAHGIYDNFAGTQRLCIERWKPKLSIKVNFTKTSGNVSLTAGNGEYALAGATYEIFNAATNKKVATITTDDEGRASCKLPVGSYYARETKAPQGFVLDSEPHRFTVAASGSSANVKLKDTPGFVTLAIAKKDSATGGEPQPGATLEGAEYKVVDANGDIHTGTTDRNGQLVVGPLPLGAISVTETKAPEGYVLDPTVYTYTVTAEDMPADGAIELAPSSDFKEDVIAFDIEIAKTKGDDDPWNESDGHEIPAEDVQFEIVSNTTGEVIGTVTTDADGFIDTSEDRDLWFGRGDRPEGVEGAIPYDAAGYTVREVPSTVPEGFDIVGDWTIAPEQMVDGAKLRYVMNDQNLSTRLQIVKKDAHTGLTVPCSGFSFQIVNERGELVSMTDWYPNAVSIDTFTTGDDGTTTLPERLEPGTYTIREVASSAPYLTGDDISFTVSANHEDATPLAVIEYPNEQAMGIAHVEKACAGTPSDHSEPCSLAGAEFDVVAVGDIVSPDGTVRAVDGEVVDHIVTDENGQADTRELWLGSGTATYALIETKAPSGHALDSEPHELTLTYADAETSIVYADVTVTDEPTTIIIDKHVMHSDLPLADAIFELWRPEDEISLEVEPRMGAVAVRAPGADSVSVSESIDYAQATAVLPDGWKASLSSNKGAVPLGTNPEAFSPGTYTLTVTDETGVVDLGDDETIELGVGDDVRITGRTAPFDGKPVVVVNRSTIEEREALTLKYDKALDAFTSTALEPGTYDLLVDGTTVGTLEAEPDRCCFGVITDASLTLKTHLLMPDVEPISLTTGEDGQLSITHLAPGAWRIEETAAPVGYLTDQTIHELVVGTDGRIEGEAAHTVTIDNDYTKVEFSKRDVTNEEEVPGATLTILDAAGEVVASWVSGEEPHRIDALEPGVYRLVEEMTPHTYDKATEVPFTVLPTGDVQKVVMYDKPIEVSGDVDKRQEIADPVAPGTAANGDGANRAEVSVSPEGLFDYSVDIRSTATTWVDEFTLTDDIYCAEEGYAELISITTPQGSQDYDGKLNVWYRVSSADAGTAEDSEHASTAPSDDEPESAANATLSDGHENPWLHDETTAERLGDDGRALDYSGWRLWAEDVSATEAETLSVSDLHLAEGERVVGIRLEYGRVEAGFTTRPDGWERPDLKDAHDDLDDVEATHGSSFDVGEGEYAPLILHMKATETYTDEALMYNGVRLDLFRNGGDASEENKLEDHDEDGVVQVPKVRGVTLAQTGVAGIVPSLVAVSTTLLIILVLLSRKKRLK